MLEVYLCASHPQRRTSFLRQARCPPISAWRTCPTQVPIGNPRGPRKDSSLAVSLRGVLLRYALAASAAGCDVAAGLACTSNRHLDEGRRRYLFFAVVFDCKHFLFLEVLIAGDELLSKEPSAVVAFVAWLALYTFMCRPNQPDRVPHLSWDLGSFV